MASKSTCRVLIADAEPVFAYGLRRLLEEADGFEVVAQTTDAGEALRLSSSVHPDLAFLDAALLSPESDALSRVAERGDTKVILWASSGDSDPLVGALRLGARGVLARAAPFGLVEKAARCVAAGQYWIGREAVGDVIRWLRQSNPTPNGHAQKPAPDSRLTAREREIVTAVAAGQCNKDVAARLSISEDTVKHHLTSVFAKLGVSTRLELAVFATRHGLVEKAPTSSVR